MKFKVKSKVRCACGGKAYFNSQKNGWFCCKTFVTIYDEDLYFHKQVWARRKPAFWWLGYAITAASLITLGCTLWVAIK